jgi:hypothetical protein
MMSNLTDGMIRLSEEISTLRHHRAALTCDLMLGRVSLGKTVAEMIAGFHRDRQEMGEKTKTELDESKADLEHSISEMIDDFQRDRQEMGEKTKVEVGEFVSNLRVSVAGLRAEFATDIQGAQKAWSGAPGERTGARNFPEERSFPENPHELENLNEPENLHESGNLHQPENLHDAEDLHEPENLHDAGNPHDSEGRNIPGKPLRHARSKIRKKKH